MAPRLPDLGSFAEPALLILVSLCDGPSHGYAIMLDVDQDARWVAPLIVAATGADDPGTDYWTLRDDKLVQLLIGLSTLVESTTLVVGHRFGSRNRKMGYA